MSDQINSVQVKPKTMIVTGASQGIGAGVTKAFLKRGYNVVATSRKITESTFTPMERLALVDGDIAEASTAARIAATAIGNFGSIDGVVNNVGVFFRSHLRTIPSKISSSCPKRIWRATSTSRSLP